MGLLDTLFGGGSKPEPVLQKQSEPAATVSTELKPEIVAAIAASISCVLDIDTNARCGVLAVKNEYIGNAWALTGRQKVMDARQFR